ncbi:MAG: DUF3800 domain-containing protein [Bacteroidetes bacterium]|jgi:hypothetical protein|nr:DUF3800 domain-containing protein [Bacteroidota bacterium]MBT4412270.1 DUF3800 domain-containing protein [Bacteroidota bacterium]MBT6051690.1 DUF3800 domain-containing protein [Candidatus Scalindua sp.]MBT7464609.1 DUF3800 domain-containing protein [Bacteroidota bacterium]
MSNKTFNFYCDESTHLQNDGMPFFILSYVSCPYKDLKTHKIAIKGIREKHSYKGEFKWSKISSKKELFFQDIINYFFSSSLTFRAIIIDKSSINIDLSDNSYEDFYFRMYYQLIHHKLDLENKYNIYFDIKDTRSYIKLDKLHEILHWNASIRSFQFIHSYESSIMQITDLIMGAVNYKLRGLNKVQSKLNLISQIEENCGFSLSSTTSKEAEKINLFHINLRK